MSEKFNIIRNSKMSVDSVDVERSLTLGINSTSSILHDTDIKSTIDLNEQYLKERNACDDYRLILTIKPYCTNVLFNACTECVIDEGSDTMDVVMEDDTIDEGTIKRIGGKIKGKNVDVGIYDMIRNTEYSREGIGFEYHPGLDIFNNHIIRNKSYRIVNDYNKVNNRNTFNTISDYMRSSDGNILKRCCRLSVEDTTMKEKHLYDKDDILPFYTGEAISENLREQDGWFGFYNTSVISAKSVNGKDMDISRVINSKGNCEFIDMYPDRTLYSFVPKYNPHRNRLEYNWDYAITYAFESTTTYHVRELNKDVEKDFNLIQNGEVNALATISVQYRKLPNGSGAIFFRSATKHNLKPMDKVYIYFDENEDGEDWYKSYKTYLVAGIGDINHKEQDYYFYITDLDLLEEIFCTPYLCDIKPQQADHTYGAWNYVRDYFYTEYNPTKVPAFDENKITKLNQLVTYGSQVYIANQEHTGIWDNSHFDRFDLISNDNVVKYPDEVAINTGQLYSGGSTIPVGKIYFLYDAETGTYTQKIVTDRDLQVPDDNTTIYKAKFEGGLTNIPTKNDWIIKVKDAEETNAKYFILCNHDRNIQYDGSTDAFLFIQAIINNAFTNKDKYPDTNPNDIETDGNTNNDVNQSMLGEFSDYISVRFVKTNGNYDCNYYVRKFKKVPGLQGLTLDKETYQLAFSNTIYGDKIAQSVFTDNVNVSGLKDNLGRDLTEVFLTIVKANRGHDKWYNITDEDASGNDNPYNDPDIEYSHCFGSVTCGFELSNENDDTLNIRTTRGDYYDVTLINPSAAKQTIPNNYEVDGFSTEDIKIDNDWFYGDIVEFCPWTCEETVISDVCFRFNTAQRDKIVGTDVLFKFDEISSDDYDDGGFKIATYNVRNMTYRPEGYYHKAHYRIPLRDLSPVIQGSHPYISVLEAIPIQVDGIYILVRCSLKHNLNNDSKVLLRDTTASVMTEWWLDVAYVVNDYTFVMNIIPRNDPNYVDWTAICYYLNNNEFTLRGQNMEIPEKAARLGVNTYLWRNPVNILDITNTDSEVNSYVFANNAVYIDKCFNFYLKRQDPYNVNGLYFDGSNCVIECNTSLSTDCSTSLDMSAIDKWFLGDVESMVKKDQSDNEYNDMEYEALC